jgi:hypothetical protein
LLAHSIRPVPCESASGSGPAGAERLLNPLTQAGKIAQASPALAARWRWQEQAW